MQSSSLFLKEYKNTYTPTPPSILSPKERTELTFKLRCNYICMKCNEAPLNKLFQLGPVLANIASGPGIQENYGSRAADPSVNLQVIQPS